jgi:flagellar basal-body rod protein FlgC
VELTNAIDIAAGGMSAQSTRLRVIAENLANSSTTGSTPGADPYRRKTVEFQNTMDRTLGLNTVSVKKINPDSSNFPHHYDPTNPAADGTGYVKTPNVNSFVEVMDMKEAQRSYSANINVLETTRNMMSRTIDILK